MKEIQISTWSRKEAFELFKASPNPHFSVTADINVTRLIKVIKPTGLSTFNVVLFALAKAANSIPEFRVRFKGDKVYQYPVCHPSVTVPITDTNFAFCETEFSDHWPTFNDRCTQSIAAAKKQTRLKESENCDHQFFFTCSPWLHFTGMTHAHNGVDDCIPRFAWGKYSQRGDDWFMPLNVQVHHAVTDGYHAAQLFLKTEAILAEEEFI
ncbi:MAG: CatA-like O-acetyltransferase [Sneathiella sp.]